MTDTLIWISGASSGIGAALAATVPFADAHVVNIARSDGGGTVEHLPADLTDPAAWAAVEAHFVARLSSFGGSRAIFVHNAGTLDPVGFAGAVDTAAYHRNVLLNSAAPQALGHGFLRAAAQFTGRADLVMLSSGAAQTPYEGWSSYCAGKAAVDQWIRTVGKEQDRRPDGVRCLAVAPGVVATPMQERIRGTSEDEFPAVGKFRSLHEDGALIEPQDAAGRMWSLLDRDLPNGAVVDLRKL